jgi:hypothetical protein
MQKDRPFVPRVIERPFQFLYIGQHAEPALRVGVRKWIGFDRRALRDLGRGAGRKFQYSLGRLLRQMLGNLKEPILSGPPDLIEPFWGNAIAEQRIIGDAGKQQPFLFTIPGLDPGINPRMRSGLDPFRQLDQLRRTARRVPFDAPPLGPSIGDVMVPDKNRATGSLACDEQST